MACFGINHTHSLWARLGEAGHVRAARVGHSPPQVGRAQGQEPRSAAPQEAGAGGLVKRGSTGAQRTEEGRD